MVGNSLATKIGKIFTRMYPKTVTGGGGSVMLWGCISFGKLGPLIQVNERLISRYYISEILDISYRSGEDSQEEKERVTSSRTMHLATGKVIWIMV